MTHYWKSPEDMLREKFWGKDLDEVYRKYIPFYEPVNAPVAEGAAIFGGECLVDRRIISHYGFDSAVGGILMKFKAIALHVAAQILTGKDPKYPQLERASSGVQLKTTSHGIDIGGKLYAKYDDTGNKVFPNGAEFFLRSPSNLIFSTPEWSVMETDTAIGVRVESYILRQE
jgi:hypothetical protein